MKKTLPTRPPLLILLSAVVYFYLSAVLYFFISTGLHFNLSSFISAGLHFYLSSAPYRYFFGSSIFWTSTFCFIYRCGTPARIVTKPSLPRAPWDITSEASTAATPAVISATSAATPPPPRTSSIATAQPCTRRACSLCAISAATSAPPSTTSTCTSWTSTRGSSSSVTSAATRRIDPRHWTGTRAPSIGAKSFSASCAPCRWIARAIWRRTWRTFTTCSDQLITR